MTSRLSPAAIRRRAMRAGAAMAMLCMARSLPAAGAEQPLVTAPIDYSIYREGAVQRLERRYGAWTLTCDEIKSLTRKFCSLRGVARAGDGTIIASLAVSTDERGRPAALVTLPFGTVLQSGMLVMKAGKKTPAARLDLRPALCDQQGCEVVWSLMPDDIRTMSLGAPLPMRFEIAPSDVQTHLHELSAQRFTIQGALQTDGFADALQASLQ